MLNTISRNVLLQTLFLVVALCFATDRAANAQRPTAPKLLPEKTLAYFRVANTPELIEKFRQTATGRMARDEKLKPLLGQLWQVVVDAFKQVEGQVGAPLNELVSIPQGEICLALVAPEMGRPQFVVWLDCGDKILTMNKLIDRAEQELLNRNAARHVEILGDVELVLHDSPNGRRQDMVYFIKDQTLVIASSIDLAKQVLGQWSGQNTAEVMTLADNRKFTAIMSRSMGTKGEEPQVTWFLDPFELARRAGRGNASTQTGIALLSGLGIDGIKGVGGSMTFATEEFDFLMHNHILLETPRKGVVDALALQPGDVNPEPWAPVDLESYMTLNWNVPKTYGEVVRLYEMFRGGEGAWKSQVTDRLSERVGVDLEKDVIHGVTGRFTMLTWMEKPARINSQSTLLGIKLVDADATRKVIDRLVAQAGDRITKKSFGGVSYYETPMPRDPRQQTPDENIVRPMVFCIAVMDDYLLLSNGNKVLERAILTKSDSSQNLANELDYKIIASKIKRQLGDAEAGMILFSRPEESMRQLYDLATSDNMRGILKTQSENNPFLKGVNSALNDNPLPPFSVLAQYLAPSGALVTNDETGFHYLAFALRREE